MRNTAFIGKLWTMSLAMYHLNCEVIQFEVHDLRRGHQELIHTIAAEYNMKCFLDKSPDVRMCE